MDETEQHYEDASDDSAVSHLRRIRAYFLKNVALAPLEAIRTFRKLYDEEGDPAALFEYAQILASSGKLKAAAKVLSVGWNIHKDVECLQLLTWVKFRLKNSKEAIPLFNLLEDIGAVLDKPLGMLLRDFEFPRDFDALEALGVEGEHTFFNKERLDAILSAIEKGKA